MARSIEDRKRALAAYLETRSIEATARLVNISPNTLQKWSRKDRWADQLEKHLAKAADRPLEIPAKDLQVLDDLEISPEKKDVLIQIKIVEGVCLACIRDDLDEVGKSVKGLKPKTFSEAINALEKCWKARKDILYANESIKNSGDTTITKIDYVAEMRLASTLKQKQLEPKYLESKNEEGE